MLSIPSFVLIVSSLGMIAVIFIMVSIGRMFRKAGPNEAFIVYGFGGTHVVKGGGKVSFPMIHSVRSLSLELMSFCVAPQRALYTKQGVAVTVEAVAPIKAKCDDEPS